MNFANDSMHTSLCLQFDPQHVATACVYLAAQFTKVRPNNGIDWLDALGQPDVETLASIAYQIVELIAGERARKKRYLLRFEKI
jgi:cyclin T